MSFPRLGSLALRQTLRNERLPNLCLAFSTTSISQAPKKAVKKPTLKRKTPMRKAPGGGKGPKSTKRASGSDSSSSVSRTNPFLEPQRKMLHLEELIPETAISDKICKPMAWTSRTLEATRIQGFGLTRELARKFKQLPRPRSVFRQKSLDLFDLLDKSSKSASTSSNTLLRGPIGVGISTLMLQGVSYALESSWIVIYIPRAINLVDSSSPYTYNELLQTYLQPNIAREMLESILAVNKNQLAKLSILQEGTLDDGRTLEKGLELTRAIELGLRKDSTSASTQQILELVIRSIWQQDEIPVLMAIDGVQALFSTTQYRDPDYRQLQSYELAIPRLLQACLRKAGPGSLGGQMRGTSLTAFSLQHKKWPISIETKTVLQLDGIDAYAKMDEIMLEIVEECRFSSMDISPSLSLAEATSMYDLTRDEGGRWIQHNDEMLMSKMAESGGNIGIFERSLRRSVI